MKKKISVGDEEGNDTADSTVTGVSEISTKNGLLINGNRKPIKDGP